MPHRINKIEQIKLTSGRSLMHSNVPDGVKLCNGKSCEVLTEESIASFGLFETNAPNFNTYYPDVTAADLIPKEDEFINPIFRALSSTTVRKFAPIDFSKKGVLEASLPKLVGISIFTDHEQNTGNVLGAVKSAEWQKGYTVGGVKVPSGINTKFNIDGKSHPQLARGIMADPPSYHSVSVTVSYKWEWSHSKLTDDECYSKWGTFDDKGNLVRKVVTEIVLYSEISIVPLGADPFARLLKDGKITNPQFVLDRQSLSATAQELGAMDNTVVNFQEVSQFSNYSNNPKLDDMTLSELFVSLGLEATLTEDQFKTMFQGLQANKVSLAAILAVDPELTPVALTALKAVVGKTEAEDTILTFVTDNGGQDKLLEVVEFQTTALAAQRTEAVKFYKLVQGESFKEEIVANIEAATGATLSAMEDQYKDEYEAKVPLACTSCGSEEISRKASKNPEEGSGEDTRTFQEKMQDKQFEASVKRIHGEQPA